LECGNQEGGNGGRKKNFESGTLEGWNGGDEIREVSRAESGEAECVSEVRDFSSFPEFQIRNG
jgi:hypothetical protein